MTNAGVRLGEGRGLSGTSISRYGKRNITVGDLRPSDRGKRLKVRRRPDDELTRPESFGRIWGIQSTPYWIGMMRREGVTITLSFPSRFGNRNFESLGPFPMNWPAQIEVPNQTPQPKRHRRRSTRAGTNDRSS